jgi:Uma2 family endonuclease
MASVATPERLITIDEYLELACKFDGPTELVRGRIITMNPPYPWHGYVCGRVVLLVGGFIETNDRGYSVCNDSGVATQHDPDTMRGADFAFYSYQRVPKGSFKQKGYLPVAPDLVIEVKSPSDSWKAILTKVAEYLNAGVTVVCVLDPERQTATVYQADQPEQTLSVEQTLTFPQVLPGFSTNVKRFFE